MQTTEELGSIPARELLEVTDAGCGEVLVGWLAKTLGMLGGETLRLDDKQPPEQWSACAPLDRPGRNAPGLLVERLVDSSPLGLWYSATSSASGQSLP